MPITAYDKRNPFHRYNMEYEQARLKGPRAMHRFLSNRPYWSR